MSASAQVAKALSDNRPSQELNKLMTEVHEERKTFVQQRDQSDARSLDPMVERKEALAARERANDARFEIARIDAAIEKLSAATQHAKAREAASVRRSSFDKVREERDTLVKDLEQYPVLAKQIVALLTRLEQSDKAIKVANTQIPGGETALQSAEVIARAIPAHFRDANGHISRLSELTLPAFRRDDLMRPYMWHHTVEPHQRNPG